MERYGIPGIVLMENAARNAASVALEMLRADDRSHVSIVCGEGNNGGDGWAMARHLHNVGMQVRVFEVGASRPGTDAAVNRDICHRMAIAVHRFDETEARNHRVGAGAGGEPSHDGWHRTLIVDAIFGTGLARAPEGMAAQAIDEMNLARARGAPILAVDIPSGLDADAGVPLGAAVRATTTVTFVAPKPGLLAASATEFVGRLVVVDIGAPPELAMQLVRGHPNR